MLKLTSGRLIENDRGDKLNGVSTNHHALAVYSLPWVTSEDFDKHFDKLVFAGFPVKAEIEMSFFFTICTFDLKRSHFLHGEFIYEGCEGVLHALHFKVIVMLSSVYLQCFWREYKARLLSTGYLRQNIGLLGYSDIWSNCKEDLKKKKAWIWVVVTIIEIWTWNSLHSHRNAYTDQYSI